MPVRLSAASDAEAIMKLTSWIFPVLLFVSFVPAALAQSGNKPLPPITQARQWSHQHPQAQWQEDDELLVELREKARKADNLQRQSELEHDSDALLQMANELKQYVNKTNENVLSLEVIRKAEQIEKLAKNVKEKMKANY